MDANLQISSETAKACVDYAADVIVSKTYDYEGNPVTFNKGDNVMVSATEMARPFGKMPKDWLKTQTAKDFITTLSGRKKILPSDLVKVTNGDGGGTWMHEDVALEFARWLSPDFAIWTNDHIKELLQVGMTATPATLEELVDNPDLVIAYATRLKQLRAENAEKQRKIDEQREKLVEAAPKVEFHDKIIASDDTCLVRELAKVLTQRGFKIGQNRLYELLRNEGYLIKHGSDRNSPTQPYVDNGIFEVDRKPWTNPKTGEVHIGKTSKVTSKGLRYFIGKFLGRAAVL